MPVIQERTRKTEHGHTWGMAFGMVLSVLPLYAAAKLLTGAK